MGGKEGAGEGGREGEVVESTRAGEGRAATPHVRPGDRHTQETARPPGPPAPPLAPPPPTLSSSTIRTRPSLGWLVLGAWAWGAAALTRTDRAGLQHGQPAPWAFAALRETLVQVGTLNLERSIVAVFCGGAGRGRKRWEALERSVHVVARGVFCGYDGR